MSLVENSLSWVVDRLFKRTAIVLVGGIWKMGKTDFALSLAKRALKLGLVSEIASNVDTFGEFAYIVDTETLKAWLDHDGKNKLFVFDEGNEHLPNTGFMSKKSTGLKAVIPQMSKKHGRLIVIAQDLDAIDKTFRNKSWWRGTFKKIDKKTATFTGYWNINKPLLFTDIPRTSVKFDPYVSAPWTETSEAVVFFNDSDKQILWDWSNGKTTKELGIHPQKLNRLIRPFVKRMLQTERGATIEKRAEEVGLIAT